MNNKGFASLYIVLGILGVVVALGVGAGVRYFLNQEDGSGSVVTILKTNPSDSVPAPSDATTDNSPSLPPNSTGIQDCGTNTNCFILASQSCIPAVAESTSTVVPLGTLDQLSQSKYSISGLDSSGKCVFSTRIEKIAISPTTITDVKKRMNALGGNDVEIVRYIKDSDEKVEASVDVTIKCAIEKTVLSQILNRWARESFNSKDLMAENCSIIDENGNPIGAVSGIGVFLSAEDTELIKQVLDSRRVNDLRALMSLVELYLANVPNPVLCEKGKVYRSNAGTTVMDGTGWLPINMQKIENGSPLSKLPTAPSNNNEDYYSYVCDPGKKTYEFNARLESEKYNQDGASNLAQTDGGNNPKVFEIGSDLKLLP